MSVRGYFSLRYAVPGYTFILLVVTINFVPLSVFLAKQTNLVELAPVFGALLALLSGSAIGFLIGHPWWWLFHKRGGLPNFACVEHLKKKRHLPADLDDRKVLHVFDYILHVGVHSDSKTKGLSLYLFRRWDMYVLESCTMTSLILGTVTGFLIRIVTEFSLFQSSAFKTLPQMDYQAIFGNGESWLLIGIFVSMILLVCFLSSERQRTKEEYNRMHETVIDNHSLTEAQLRSVFPSYFTDSQKETMASAKN